MQENIDSLSMESERNEEAVQTSADGAAKADRRQRAESRISPEKQAMRDFREKVVILMYLTGFYEKADREEQARRYLEDVDASGETREKMYERYREIAGAIGRIDPMITEASKGWKLNRIGKVELNILRVAVYEMYFDETVPVSVAINEAVELAGIYGVEQSHAFVNGILSEILKRHPVPETQG